MKPISTEKAPAAIGPYSQAILRAAGLSLSHVVKTTVFLADMGDFAAMNEVYARFFQPPFPGLVSTKDMAKVGIIIGAIGFVLAFFWLTKIFPFAVR